MKSLRAVIHYRIVYGGGYAIMEKRNGKWTFVEAHNTWMENRNLKMFLCIFTRNLKMFLSVFIQNLKIFILVSKGKSRIFAALFTLNFG